MVKAVSCFGSVHTRAVFSFYLINDFTEYHSLNNVLIVDGSTRAACELTAWFYHMHHISRLWIGSICKLKA